MAEKGESLRDVILRMAQERGSEASFGPNEVAQEMWPSKPDEIKGQERWRKLVRPVRGAAIGLARQGEIDILRRKVVIDPHKPWKGVYTLRLAERAILEIDDEGMGLGVDESSQQDLL